MACVTVLLMISVQCGKFCVSYDTVLRFFNRMNPRGFHFQFQGRRGIPAVLPLILMAFIAIGIVALVVFVGLAVAMVGLSVYACALLYNAVRRKLSGSYRPSGLEYQVRPQNTSPGVRVIEVEAVRVDRE